MRSLMVLRKTSRSDGFTLVELLVAIAISAVFIGAVTTLIIQNSRMAQRTRDVAVTNSFVENKIEALRSAGFLTLADGTTNITSELPSELQASRNATLTISSMSTAVKKIDLAVLYNDLGSAKSYTYTTYIGELGVGQY